MRGICVLLTATACFSAYGQEKPIVNLVFCCEEDNDLYRVVSEAADIPRFDNAAEAVANAPEGAGVLVLADGYPEKTTLVDQALFDAAAAKGIRLYVEFPAWLPGIGVGEPQSTHWERAAVASDAFGPELERLRIMAIHDCTFVPVKTADPDILVARIAGFDTAVYGLPGEAFPILFRLPDSKVVVATTKLSQFLTARYAPSDAWRTIIPTLLGWLTDADLPELDWTATVRPSFQADAPLSADVERDAVQRGTDWFFNAKLFPAPSWTDDRSSWKDNVGPEPEPDWPVGDGSMGFLEGYSSAIRHDGSQHMRWWLRNDCMGEGMMALAFNGAVGGDARFRDTAKRLGNFVYFDSPITKGPRDDPKSGSYGLMSWDMNKSLGVFYGDDNARALLGGLACAALLDEDAWDEKMLRCLLANLRTTGPQGFRSGRIDQ
ncbi:MAG: hypothetical protein GY851_07640, partial [bacterium]|nr:hypothetical protein [bacterium]